MSNLTARDRELVALGAAMGSNCVPCIEHHIPESRKIGLTDTEILAAIRHADTIRQVPARKVLEAAERLLSSHPGVAGDDDGGRKTETAWPSGMMADRMAAMMGTPGCSERGQATAHPSPNAKGGCC
ncbi:MAG: carboxymuconolactone decarboxylase family protein [Rhodospirillales bacterium]|nr:carboxymuconolactone decarboxylase family protein [Rhodospirillales bacterium]